MRKLKIVVLVVALISLLAGCQESVQDGFTYPPYDGSRVIDGTFMKEYSLTEYQELLNNSVVPNWFVSYDQIAFMGKFVKYELQLKRNQDYAVSTHSHQRYYLEANDGCEIRIDIVHTEGDTVSRKNLKISFDRLKRSGWEMPEMGNFLYPEDKMRVAGDFASKYHYEGIFYGYNSTNQLWDIAWYNKDSYIEITLFPNSRGVYDYPEAGFGAIDALFAPETAKDFVNKVNVATLAPYYAKEYWPVFVLSAVVISLLAMVCVMVIKRRRKKQSATTVDDELREILS